MPPRPPVWSNPPARGGGAPPPLTADPPIGWLPQWLPICPAPQSPMGIAAASRRRTSDDSFQGPLQPACLAEADGQTRRGVANVCQLKPVLCFFVGRAFGEDQSRLPVLDVSTSSSASESLSPRWAPPTRPDNLGSVSRASAQPGSLPSARAGASLGS
ncbi:hypothetical protein PCL_06202 [Purpureocillium lilacinum]|uniref:Uncharacterized protein n=2 Tax=Purpureocillium lilacinum TaxID=33203 RepID=A0A2U3EM10_PURLI|nr:hypothetical protein Purlil1_4148 [Purpureocillium lilacinum]PWI75544.1 hypothetical protein PCL_06202 [Purpureocillium lilacinum]